MEPNAANTAKFSSTSGSSSVIGKVLLVVGIVFIVLAIGLFLDWFIRGKNYVYCFKSKNGKKDTVKVNANNNTMSNINLVNKSKKSNKDTKSDKKSAQSKG